jgi:hypothetical protein
MALLMSLKKKIWKGEGEDKLMIKDFLEVSYREVV